jgi:hypothetical protein
MLKDKYMAVDLDRPGESALISTALSSSLDRSAEAGFDCTCSSFTKRSFISVNKWCSLRANAAQAAVCTPVLQHHLNAWETVDIPQHPQA